MRILTRWPSAYDVEVERVLAAAEGGLRDGSPADILASYRSDARLSLFVAFDDGVVVGCVGARPADRHVHLQHLSVCPDPRRRNIAKRLVTEVLMRHPVRLEAETCAEAAAFYRRLGFTITPVRVHDAIRYRCTLGNPGARAVKAPLAS